MLSKKNRLNRLEIERLKTKSNDILQGKIFGLIFQKSKGERKFGLIVSNKIASKASKRNEIKRLFFRAIHEKLFDQEGKFLFLAKKHCLVASLEEFEREMENFKSKLS